MSATIAIEHPNRPAYVYVRQSTLAQVRHNQESTERHWNEVITDQVIFDAIRDRLEHSALTIHITGPTYRGVKAKKLASRKKDA